MCPTQLTPDLLPCPPSQEHVGGLYVMNRYAYIISVPEMYPPPTPPLLQIDRNDEVPITNSHGQAMSINANEDNGFFFQRRRSE